MKLRVFILLILCLVTNCLAIQKNVNSQKWVVFAFDRTDNTAKTGNAGSITGSIWKDGAEDAIADGNPTELAHGYYEFDLDQAETNGDYLVMDAVSATGDIQVVGCPMGVWTTAPYFSALSIDATGRVDIAKWIGTAVTLSSGNKPDVNIDEISDDTTAPGNLELMYDGTGYAGGTIVLEADLTKIGGVAQSATDLKDFADNGFDPTSDGVLLQDGTGTGQIDLDAGTVLLRSATETQIDDIDTETTDLKYLLNVDTSIAANADLTSIVADGSVLSHIMTPDADTSFYEAGHESLYAIRHRGDRAWTTGVGASPSESYQILTITRTIGDAEGGDDGDVDIVDGVTFDTGETAAGTFLEVDATFSAGTGEDAASVNIWGYYAGGAGHYILVQAYNYIDSTFEEIGTMGNASVVSYYSFQMGHAHIDPANGNMAIKLVTSAGSGITSHVLVIDKIIVTTTSESLLDANVVLILADTEAWDSANKARTLLTGGTTALSILTTSDNIGINWGDVSNPTTVINLSGTTIKTATDVEADTDDIGVAGIGLTAINLPNQTMDIIGNITGDLSGSVGTLTGGVDLTKIHGTAITETTSGRLAANFTTFIENADSATAKTLDDVGGAAGLEVDVTKIHGTAINESSTGRIAANFSTFWDNADAATAKVVDNVGASAAGGGSPLVINAGNLGDYKKNTTVYFIWRTIDQGGAAINPSGAGVIRVYKNNGTGEVTAPKGITDTRIFDSLTGIHLCAIDLNANSFYALNRDYSVVLANATIDSQTVTAVIGTFSIEKKYSEPFWIYN